MSKRRIVFGAMLHGVGTGWDNWKHPQAVADAGTNFPFYVRQLKTAEAAKFDFAFIADSVYITPKSTPHYLNRFEPLSLLGALAAVSTHIGLVGTFTVAYNQHQPDHRRYAGGSRGEVSGEAEPNLHRQCTYRSRTSI